METHNEIFNKLQEDYLKTRNPETLSKMYLVILELQTNYIKNYCKKKSIYLDIEEKAEDASTWVIERYLKNPDFKIDKISAYAYFGFLKSMFKDSEQEKNCISYDSLIAKLEKEDTSFLEVQDD